MVNTLVDNPSGAPTIILAHGAGAPMDSPFMNAIAAGLAAAGLRVVRFEFPYMADRRADGKKRPPNGAAILMDTWRAVFAEYADAKPFVAGKSMGGRIASMLADELGARGLVCLGYPFHPPGKPETLRVEHLEVLTTPALILQGTRDPFGTKAEVENYALSPAIDIGWIESGNHSFVPLKKSGHTEETNLAHAVELALAFIEKHA